MEFSSRIPTDWTPSPWSQAMEAVRLEAKAGGPRLCDLTVSTPLAAGISWDGAALAAVLSQDQGWMGWSPDARGPLAARLAIAAYEARKGGDCTAEELLLVASTSEAYSLIFRTLCSPGQGVLVPRPGYPLLDVLADLDQLQCHGYSLQLEDGRWNVAWDSLEDSPSNCRVVLVVNPNNPTGSMLDRSAWLRLASFCEARGMALVVDEVFCDHPLQHVEPVPWRELAARIPVFRLNGLSKSVGLPQLKLAWIWHGCPERDREALCQALEYVADAYLNVSSLPAGLVPELLERQAWFLAMVRDRLQRNLAIAVSQLQGLVESLPMPQGGWYLCLRNSRIDDEEFSVTLAQQDRVLVQPGYFFDFAEDGWLVISLLAEPVAFDEGLCRLTARLRSLPRP